MKKLIVFFIAGLMTVHVWAAALTGEATATFDVKATVDSFVGNATSEPVTLDWASDELAVEFIIDKMETGKKKRNKEMFHMFHSDEYPVIKGATKPSALKSLEFDDTGFAQLPITLTIHGKSQDISATISGWEETEEALVFDATFIVALPDYDLKPPSIMGLIKVKPNVMADCRFNLKKQ